MFVTNLRDIAFSTLQAYALGRLGFQQPGVNECQYRYDNGARCGIGAGLDEDTAKRMDIGNHHGDSSISSCIAANLIEITDDYDWDGGTMASARLQNMHDRLVSHHLSDDIEAFLIFARALAAGEQPKAAA